MAPRGPCPAVRRKAHAVDRATQAHPNAGMSYENPEVDHSVNVSQGSALGEFASLSMWLALGTVLAVVAVYVAARFLAPFIPFAWERRMADSVVTQWVAAKPEDKATAALHARRQQWLQALAEDLRPAMRLPQAMPISVHWLPGGEPNAFATLGGHVFINQGLLDRVGSENAVAMVMAHEMAHVQHRDPIVSLGGGLMVGLSLGVVFGGNSTLAGEAATALSQLHFSRAQERAADDAALAALTVRYGHLADADAFFTRMLCDEGQDKDAPQSSGSGSGSVAMPEFMRTHPDTAARVRAIGVARDRLKATASLPKPLPAFMHNRPVKACEAPRSR